MFTQTKFLDQKSLVTLIMKQQNDINMTGI
jgi:hypothetical protein